MRDIKSKIARFIIKILVSALLLSYIFPSSLALSAESDPSYDVYIDGFLVFENVKEHYGAYYVPLDKLISFLNIKKLSDNGSKDSVFLKTGDTYRKNYESGPFKIQINTERPSGWKRVFWNNSYLGYGAAIFNGVECVDLKTFSSKTGYKFSIYSKKIDIDTMQYENIIKKARIKLVLLPSSTKNITAAPEKMQETFYREEIADPFADAFYGRLVSLFQNIYGDEVEIVTIDKYLEYKKNVNQLNGAVEQLKSVIKFSNQTDLLYSPSVKYEQMFGNSFESKECGNRFDEYTKAILNDIIETSNAQGLIYTNLEQVGTNSNSSWYSYYYDGFYFKPGGFCYMKDGTVLPLNNDSFVYEKLSYYSNEQRINGRGRNLYYPAYFKGDRLYYIMPLSFLFSDIQIGDQVKVVDKMTNEIDITSKNKKVTNVKEIALYLEERLLTIDQYATGFQLGQALAALDEVIPQMLEGVRYNLLCNNYYDDYADYLYNIEAVNQLTPFDDSAEFDKVYAKLLLLNGFYKEASALIKLKKPILSDTPQYLEMLALEALQEGNYTEAEKHFKNLTELYIRRRETAEASNVNRKIIYLYKLNVLNLNSLGKYTDSIKLLKYLISKDPANANEYSLMTADCYEKASYFRDAYDWYNKYLAANCGDKEIEAKSHELAVKLGIDDINDERAKKILTREGVKLNDTRWSLADINNDGYKDIITVSGNNASAFIYKDGDYVPGSKDMKGDTESFEDIDRDAVPEVVTGKKEISGYSNLKFTDPYIEVLKYRRLFDNKVTEKNAYTAPLKSKEAALAKLFHVTATKNESEFALYPKKIKDFITINKLNMEKKVITKSSKQQDFKSGETLTVIIQSESFDKSVTFLFRNENNGYVLADIIRQDDNFEIWDIDIHGLVD
ncbi:MAG: hypothetical protein ABFD25_08165 [Clostridiaceae bacterium]